MDYTDITKIYVIVNQDKEPERYNKIIEQFNSQNINNYEIINNNIWGNNITTEMRTKYVKTDTSMRFHGRNMIDKPLSNAEISLFLNHIYCLKHIQHQYQEGIFLILESDAIIMNDFYQKLSNIIQSSNQINDWDIINIGAGQQKYMIQMGYPKTKEIKINDLSFFKENINRCTEALIWNYTSVNKFIDYFEVNEDIDSPIDTKIDVFSAIGLFNIYWCNPEIVYQGSIFNIFKSHLR